MDRTVKCFIVIPVLLLCFCVHGTAEANTKMSGWGKWGAWTSCSTTCGYGVQTRIRTWNYAARDSYGAQDTYTSTDMMQCFPKMCPVNGSWSQWGIWGECSAGCGGGKRQRHRSCTEPEPAHGGANCTGEAFEEGSCNEEACPDPPASFNISQCKSEKTFMCTNNVMCVPLKKRCDDTAHCSDGTDEVGCRRMRNKIGHVRFSNASTHHSASCLVAMMAVLISSLFVKLFAGGQRHEGDQLSLTP